MLKAVDTRDGCDGCSSSNVSQRLACRRRDGEVNGNETMSHNTARRRLLAAAVVCCGRVTAPQWLLS